MRPSLRGAERPQEGDDSSVHRPSRASDLLSPQILRPSTGHFPPLGAARRPAHAHAPFPRPKLAAGSRIPHLSGPALLLGLACASPSQGWCDGEVGRVVGTRPAGPDRPQAWLLVQVEAGGRSSESSGLSSRGGRTQVRAPQGRTMGSEMQNPKAKKRNLGLFPFPPYFLKR